MRNDEPAERMKLSGVYGIENTITMKRYVGSAIRFSKRLYEHVRLLRKGTHHSQRLQASWVKYGEEAFRFLILEVSEPECLLDCEQRHIDKCRAADDTYGYNIRPMADSSLGVKATEETRRKLRESHRGKVHSAETRRKMSEAHRGRIVTTETRRKISEANSNMSPEARRRNGDVHRGKKLSAEQCKQMGDRARGRVKSPETIRKHADALRGMKMHSVESRRKIGAAHRGKAVTTETRSKMSEAARNRWKSPEFRLKHKLGRASAKLVVIQ